jgi:hypothetical protein
MSRHSAVPRTVAPRMVEWLLARFIGHERAAALIGDLLEESAARTYPLLRFWFHALGLIALFTARSVVAYAVAFFALPFTFGKTALATWGPHAAHRPPHHWLQTITITGEIGCLCVAPTAFSLLRFGPRARLTWISFSFAAVTIAASFFWWSPVALTLVALALGFTLAAALRDRRSRLTLTVVAAATTTGVSYAVFVFWFPFWISLRSQAPWTPPHWPSPAYPILFYLPWLFPIIPAAISSTFYSRYVLRSNPEEHQEATTFPA